MTIEELEKKADEIAESMAASRILSLNFTDSEQEIDHAGDLPASDATWRMFCSDVRTFFRVNSGIDGLENYKQRFDKLSSVRVVTKNVIDEIKVLLHEVGNEVIGR